MDCWYTSGRIDEVKCVDPSRTIALDLETTGLDPDYDEILQLAIVDGRGKTILDQYFKPQNAESWPDAQEVNGISPSKVKDKPRFSDKLQVIQRLINEADLILVYNAKFDLPFLTKAGVRLRPSTLVFDVMVEYAPVADWWRRDKDDFGWVKLESCALHYGHVLSRAHNALYDSLATLQCFNSMMHDDSIAGYLELCSVCSGKTAEAWREHLHADELERERARKARAKVDIDNSPAFDKLDESIYSCFILGGSGDWAILPPKATYEDIERVRKATFDAVDDACSKHGGRLYKSQTKGASWAVIANPGSCTYSIVEDLHSKGYKVATLPDFLTYLGIDEGWDLKRWEELRADSENYTLLLYGDDPKKRAEAEKSIQSSRDRSKEQWEKAQLEKNRLEREIGAQFDEIDDSVYSCFILETTSPYVWSDRMACCAPNTLPQIEAKCTAKGGKLYKSQAKGATWAIISWPENCTYEITSRLRAKGYKAARLPEFMSFIRMKSSVRITSWEKKLEEAIRENERHMAATRASQKPSVNISQAERPTNDSGYVIPPHSEPQRKRKILPIVLLILLAAFFLSKCLSAPKNTHPATSSNSIETHASEDIHLSHDRIIDSFLHDWNVTFPEMAIKEGDVYENDYSAVVILCGTKAGLTTNNFKTLSVTTYAQLDDLENASSSKGIFILCARVMYPGYSDDDIELFWANMMSLALPVISEGGTWNIGWQGGSISFYEEEAVGDGAICMTIRGSSYSSSKSRHTASPNYDTFFPV